MKKNYTYSFLVLIVSLFFSSNSFGQLIANTETVTVFNLNTAQIVIPNILSNDTLNGIPVTLSDITIHQVSATASSLIDLQPDGSITLSPGFIPSGMYVVLYDIRLITNPNNYASGAAYIYIVNPPINAVNDAVTISSGIAAPQIILESVLDNDTLSSIPITVSNAIISQASSTVSNYFSIQPNGSVNMIASPPPGNYTINYTLCQANLPNNCDTASLTINVSNTLATVISGTYQDFNADGFTNVGDVINYTFSVTNYAASQITNITITSGEVNIDGGPLPSLNAGANNNSTFTGTHVITQQDINAGAAIITILTNGTLSGNPISVSATNSVNLNLTNGIKLNAFRDYNSNGIQDAGEPNFTQGEFQYVLNDDGTIHHITSATGVDYIYESNTTNSYDISYTVDAAYAAQYIVTPTSYSNITVANGSGIITYNFAVTAAPYNDLAVYVSNGNNPRPGFIYYNYVYIVNYGNQTVPSGTVTFTNSNLVTITTYPAGATPTATGFTYNFTNLLPNQSISLPIQMQVPVIPTVSLGQIINNTVSVTLPSGDINPSNNNSSLNGVIVGSYDPNDKAESHGPKIVYSTFTSNDYLTYTIRFENTGTAEAINIRVNDVLNSQLDETTVRMVAASNPYVLDRVGSNLTWKFDGVNLPPSIPNNNVIGHGYIIFQVKPKPGYAIGDIIPNIADIYFDFNPAIVTNPWTTEFVLTLGTADFAFDNFNYYPNPTRNSLFISNAAIMDEIEITSVLGQKVMTQTINDLQAEINLTQLSSGIYFVKITSEGQVKKVKIIKE